VDARVCAVSIAHPDTRVAVLTTSVNAGIHVRLLDKDLSDFSSPGPKTMFLNSAGSITAVEVRIGPDHTTLAVTHPTTVTFKT
jgi:hypothetical protein